MEAKAKRFKREALPAPEDYYQKQVSPLPGVGAWRRAHCPFHDAPAVDLSLSVNVVTGAFRCASCDARGGGVLDFHMRRYGCGFVDAAKALGAWEGHQGVQS